MNLLASFMNLAGPDLIVILLIILVLFGAKKLPELARGMGQAVKEFQKAKDEFGNELHKAGKSETETAKSDVKPAQLTVPQGESQPLNSAVRPIQIRRSRPATKAISVELTLVSPIFTKESTIPLVANSFANFANHLIFTQL
jgi:sec-independent protein translocase protein TatA